jgi:(methylthio)acryloyl-CoA hydratase
MARISAPGSILASTSRRRMMEAVRGSRRWHAVFGMIERGTIPWSRALHGAVVGGGLELAAATHIRVADPGAFFACPRASAASSWAAAASVRVARLMGARGWPT